MENETQNDPWAQFLTPGEFELQEQEQESINAGTAPDPWAEYLDVDQQTIQAQSEPQPVLQKNSLPLMPEAPEEGPDKYAEVRKYLESRDLIGGFRGPVAVAGGLNNAARSAAEFGAAGLEQASDFLFADEENGDHLLKGLTESISELWPKYEPDNAVESFVSKIAAPGAGAMAGTKAVAGIAKNLSGIKKGLTLFLGGELGATLTGGDEDTFLFDIMGQTKSGDFSEDVLKRRLNFLADSIVTSGGLQVTGQAVGAGAKYVKENIIDAWTKWRNLPAREQEFVTQLTDLVSGVDLATASREEIQAARERVLKHLEENPEMLVALSQRDGSKAITQDTVSLLNQNSDMTPDMKRSAESLRSAALEGGSPRLQRQLEAPTKELDETMTEVRQRRGGDESVLEAGETIQTSGLDEIAEADRAAQSKWGEVKSAERSVEERIITDPNFGPMLEKLGDKVSISMRDAHRLPAEELTDKIMQASKIMTDRKNELYAAIPDGALVNLDALNDRLEPLLADKILPESLIPKLGQTGGDFKKLNEFASRELEPLIKNLVDQNRFDDVRRLRDLKSHITDEQLDHLITSGRPDIADAAKAARDYFQDQYAPFWRDNPVLQEVQDWGRSVNSMKVPEAAQRVTDQLDSKRFIRRTENILDLAKRSEAGESAELAVDYAMGRVLDRVRQLSNKDGKLTAEGIQEATEYFNQFAPIFDKVSPAKREQLENFFTKLRSDEFNLGTLRGEAEKLEGLAKEAKDKILNEELREFFVDGGKKAPNVQASLKKLFNDPQGVKRLESISERVKDNPVARDGLQSAYLEELSQKLFTGKDRTVGSIDWNKSDMKDFLEKRRVLFDAEDEGAVDGLLRIAELAHAGDRANITRGGGGFNTRAGQQKFQTAVNMVTTWIFGVLNPTAARVRTVTGDLMKEYSEYNIAKKAADIVLADPKAFTEILRDVVRNGQTELTDLQKRMLKSAASKMHYVIDDDDEGDVNPDDPLYRQTEEALGAVEYIGNVPEGDRNLTGSRPLELTITGRD